MPVEKFAEAWSHHTIVSLFIMEITNEQEKLVYAIRNRSVLPFVH